MTLLTTIRAAILTTAALAGPALAQDAACPQDGPDAPLELHKAWIMEGWERREGDPDFVFAEEMDRYYDLVDTAGVFYDNYAPGEVQIFDDSVEYGTNWEATVNSRRSILHALTGHEGQVVGDTEASTTLGFVGDITTSEGEHLPFDARSQLGWECAGGGWVIRHEMNYAWDASLEEIASFFERAAP